MQGIKNQILGQISNSEVRTYIENNIFKSEIPNQQPSVFVRQSNFRNQINSSIMSSYIENHSIQSHKLSIKTLVNRIQGLVVLNGFSKTVEDIKSLKVKTLQVQKQNIQIEKLLSNKRQDNLKSFSVQISMRRWISQKIELGSDVNDFLSYDDQLRQAEDRLRYENMKQKLTSIVKLSQQDKERLLKNTRKQYESIKRHISTLQTVISNIQKFHPQEASLTLQIQSLQTQLNEKTLLLAEDQRIDEGIQMMQRKIQTIEMQHLNIKLTQSNHTSEKAVSGTHEQEHEHYYQTKFSELQSRLFEFEEFLKQEEQEKHLLLNQINSFNSTFNAEKEVNQTLLSKIKNNFFNSPELIDYLVKAPNNKNGKIQFLLNKLQFNFQ